MRPIVALLVAMAGLFGCGIIDNIDQLPTPAGADAATLALDAQGTAPDAAAPGADAQGLLNPDGAEYTAPDSGQQPRPDAGQQPGLDAAQQEPDAGELPGLDAALPGLDAALPGLDAGPPAGPDAGCVLCGSSCCDPPNVCIQATCTRACSASSTGTELFSDGTTAPPMVGCLGAVNWAARDGLCNAPGWTSCAAAQVVARLGATSPQFNYWSSDNLGYSTDSSNIVATRQSALAPAVDTLTCASQPMRVCRSDGATDAQLNGCGSMFDFVLAGYSLQSPNMLFGGCATYITASTLCCPTIAPAAACISPLHTEDFGDNFIFGCAYSTTYDDAKTHCASACHQCSVDEWLRRPDDRPYPSPTYDYWLSDYLCTSGTTGTCWATTSTSATCTTSARVCNAGGSNDLLGNSCGSALRSCGYSNPGPVEYLGGADVPSSAGVLCCCP